MNAFARHRLPPPQALPELMFDSDDLVQQLRQALLNVPAVLAKAGAKPAHIRR